MTGSRRRFLKSMAAAIAAASIPRPSFGLPASGRRHRVLIVGAGAAGLTAAYELSRAGHDVAVFEARSRPGGRMHTLREPFDDGLYAEAGALFLSSANPGLEYAREFGLELVPVPFRANLGTVAHVAGARVVQLPGSSLVWPLALSDDDRGLSLLQLQMKYHHSVMFRMEGLARLLEEGYPQPEFLHLDAVSLAAYWRSNGASDEAIRLMRLRYFDGYGDGIETLSTLQIAREFATFAVTTGSFQVRGGNDQICGRLAARLPRRVSFDSPVFTIAHDDAGVRFTVEQRDGRQEVTGDYAIVAVPLEVLSRITFTPSLSPLRARAMREVRGTDVTRVFVQTRSRFWEEQGLDGSGITDLPVGGVFHSTVAQPGPRGILESFTYGARARSMARLGSAERAAATRAGLDLVYPGVEAQAERAASCSWGDDPWAGGGHTAFAPGQIGTFLHALRIPEGRVFFAGDTVGGVPGYSHAAFASGRSVAEQIASLGRP